MLSEVHSCGRGPSASPQIDVGCPWIVGWIAVALIFMCGILVAPVFAQTATLASEDNWATSINWVGAAKTLVYFLLTLCGLAALGLAAWVSTNYVGDIYHKTSSHVRQQGEKTRIKIIQDGVINGNQELEALVQDAKSFIKDAGILAEQRFQMFLTNTHSAVNHMKADMEQMKYYPGILPKFNESEIWFWIVVIGLLVEFFAECAINVALLGQGASFLDAGLFAVFFAGLNILGGFLTGRIIKWFWQKINHAAAFSVGAIMVGLGVYLAAIFGKFRDVYVNGHKSIDGRWDFQQGDFEKATKFAREEVFPPSISTFIYTDITSFMPFVFAIIFFVLAMMGSWKIYDPYSGMRQVERKLREVYKRHNEALKKRMDNFKMDLKKRPDEIAKGMQQQERQIASGQGELAKFDPHGPNIKAAKVAAALLSEARDRISKLKDDAAKLEPQVDESIRDVDAQGRQAIAELIKIHKDITDFTTPRHGMGRRNAPIGKNEQKEPTL